LRWLRALAFGVMLIAAPGVSDLARESVSLIAAAACCDDGECCDAGDCKSLPGQCCAGSCAHCAFCAHPSAVAAAALLPPLLASPRGVAARWRLEGTRRSGYRAPPFRPPVG
jgi:hypothetical protein